MDQVFLGVSTIDRLPRILWAFSWCCEMCSLDGPQTCWELIGFTWIMCKIPGNFYQFAWTIELFRDVATCAHWMDLDGSRTKFLGISSILTGQLTDFLGFCGHFRVVAKCVHWVVPNFPGN